MSSDKKVYKVIPTSNMGRQTIQALLRNAGFGYQSSDVHADHIIRGGHELVLGPEQAGNLRQQGFVVTRVGT